MAPGAPRVLVVEDQPAVAKALEVLLAINDISCAVAASPGEALELVDREEFGAVVQDMNFGPSDTDGAAGLELFRRLRAIDPELPVLALTAWASLETAVAMVKEGAADYLAKPWDDAKLVATVRNLVKLRELQLENHRLRATQARERGRLERYDLCGLVYESAAMHRVVTLAIQVAASDVPVLITGPNGVGKEMIADIIVANSRRKAEPFIKVNAGALPDELLEAELFGAEQGAYTGAVKRRIGRFEAADRGTLFLDEIGNLSPAGQAKLLRVLQSGTFERLGSSDPRTVDVRILAATNVDLQTAMAEGRFREDLFFRLSVIEIRVPPLRERPEDVVPLAEAFIERLAAGGLPRRLARATRAALEEHSWPGNVRELMNRLQRAVLIGAGPELEPQDLGFGPAAEPAVPSDGEADEKRQLEKLLVESGGMVSRVASKLGISRQALYRRMQRLGIALERRPKH
ncbi:MAG TPA: sigma-54 dependent transcriptional regulator [Kofleriaceae bacterium]|nr:sigma-54 dependent transcriptional regulator [Kofleriaceae bacterium]